MGDEDLNSVRSAQSGRGRNAESPQHIPARGWWDILRRVFREVMDDRVMLIAAGATFYLILALFPALTAFVSIYGLVADPAAITDHIAMLGQVMPKSGMDLISGQLKALAHASSNALSFGFAFGLLAALWSANSGIKTLFDAMNIAYEEDEKRSFIWLNLLSLIFTLGAILVGALLITAVGVVPAAIAFLHLGGVVDTLISALRWPALLVCVAIAIAILYRYGPSREHSKWRWQVPGAITATIVWIVASFGFSWYLQNFANYNATYGSLGAIIGFLVWIWISLIILLAGAELNSEIEHQTSRDSTTGEPRPLGERGARMADTIGKTAKEV
ncbi:MAG: YihY/virulence factor BrkB family protein [Pararhizobium sp.]